MLDLQNFTVTKGLFFLLVCLLGLVCPVGAESSKTQPNQVVYKTANNSKDEPVELRLHVFKPEGWSAEDRRPAIVFFFGGGWVGGSPKQFYPHCRDLAGRGMVAISAEYRVKGKHGTPPQACVEDGKSAIRYVRKQAKSLGIDPDKIVAGGGSAGGHVAACTGVIKGFEAEGEDHAVSSVPNLMVLFNPVIDTAPKTGYGAKKVGDDPLSLSPLHQAHKDQPPSLIMHGDADTTVKIDSVRRFEKRCKQLGAACKLIEYSGAGHGFFNHRDFRKPKADAPDYYIQTMREVVGFMQQHQYLDQKANDE